MLDSSGAARRGLEASGLRLVGHSDLGGHGDASQLIRHGDYLYVGHMLSMGTTVLDVGDPARPREVGRWWLPGTWEGGGEELPTGWPDGLRYGMHHGLVLGDRAYGGAPEEIAGTLSPGPKEPISW